MRDGVNGVSADAGSIDDVIPTVHQTKPKGRPKKVKEPEEEKIKIPALELKRVVITIKATTSLIVSRFSEKAEKQMEEAQSGAPRHKKAPRDPVAEFKASLYEVPGEKDKYGFPASGLKKALVSACRFADGMSMSMAKGAFHVLGDILVIRGPKPKMRKDFVRIGGMAKVATLRYRGEFVDWKIDVPILYNARAISPSELAHLLNLAGFAVGIGEWRPERSGQFGMFEVE